MDEPAPMKRHGSILDKKPVDWHEVTTLIRNLDLAKGDSAQAASAVICEFPTRCLVLFIMLLTTTPLTLIHN